MYISAWLEIRVQSSMPTSGDSITRRLRALVLIRLDGVDFITPSDGDSDVSAVSCNTVCGGSW